MVVRAIEHATAVVRRLAPLDDLSISERLRLVRGRRQRVVSGYADGVLGDDAVLLQVAVWLLSRYSAQCDGSATACEDLSASECAVQPGCKLE
jgi:hypothetical protein